MYFSAQRESQNAALLEKIAHALTHDTETLPIRLHAEPHTFDDAADNLMAFCAEWRERQEIKNADAVQISSLPRMKKCFGWLKVDEAQLCAVPGPLGPTVVKLHGCADMSFPEDRQYFAIVYEYIPEGENDTGQMQLVLDFLWRAGFDFSQSLRKENWKSGVAVDFSDFISPMGYCWNERRYRRRIDASRAFLSPPPRPPPPADLLLSKAETSQQTTPSPAPRRSSLSDDSEDRE